MTYPMNAALALSFLAGLFLLGLSGCASTKGKYTWWGEYCQPQRELKEGDKNQCTNEVFISGRWRRQ